MNDIPLLPASFANILFLVAGLGQEDVLVFGPLPPSLLPPGPDSQFIDWRWPPLIPGHPAALQLCSSLQPGLLQLSGLPALGSLQAAAGCSSPAEGGQPAQWPVTRGPVFCGHRYFQNLVFNDLHLYLAI